MDTIDKYVCEQNVARYRDRLETETDTGCRSTIIGLLIDEERKLGFAVEQLASVDRHIARCRELITRQEALIGEMQTKGRDVSQANALLDSFYQTLEVHEEHRDNIRNWVDRMTD